MLQREKGRAVELTELGHMEDRMYFGTLQEINLEGSLVNLLISLEC